MKQEFKEINFDKSTGKFQFDCVNYEDILKKIPTNHNQFKFHKVSFYAKKMGFTTKTLRACLRVC